MEDSGFREPGVGDLCHPCPRQAILLASPSKRASPEVGNVVAECTQCLGIRGHRVVRKEACNHLLEPYAHEADDALVADSIATSAAGRFGLHLTRTGWLIVG